MVSDLADIPERGEALLQKYSNCRDKHEHLESLIKNESLLLKKAQEKHEAILTNIEEMGQALEVLKQAIVPLTERGLKRLKELVTFGLSTIFHDCHYALDIEIRERGNDKTAILWLVEGPQDDQMRVRVRDSIGGGVKTVISLILRIFFIIHYRQRRFLVMDEPFTDIHSHYLPGLFQFLRYTVSVLEFEWTIVTQDPRFLSHGDRKYRVTKGRLDVLTETENA